MKIEDAGTEYTEGKVCIILKEDADRKEALEFNLDIRLKDKTRLMNVERLMSEKKIEDKVLDDQMNIISEMIKRSYPDKTESWIESIVTKYGNELLLELYFMWKWRDREMFDKIEESKKKNMDKMVEEMFNPTSKESKKNPEEENN